MAVIAEYIYKGAHVRILDDDLPKTEAEREARRRHLYEVVDQIRWNCARRAYEAKQAAKAALEKLPDDETKRAALAALNDTKERMNHEAFGPGGGDPGESQYPGRV